MFHELLRGVCILQDLSGIFYSYLMSLNFEVSLLIWLLANWWEWSVKDMYYYCVEVGFCFSAQYYLTYDLGVMMLTTYTGRIIKSSMCCFLKQYDVNWVISCSFDFKTSSTPLSGPQSLIAISCQVQKCIQSNLKSSLSVTVSTLLKSPKSLLRLREIL